MYLEYSFQLYISYSYTLYSQGGLKTSLRGLEYLEHLRIHLRRVGGMTSDNYTRVGFRGRYMLPTGSHSYKCAKKKHDECSVRTGRCECICHDIEMD